MRLFIADSFFDKFINLPRNIQQRIRDFQHKFRGNSQSSGIHLEPIAQFKDSSLRSARVDGEYRAIIGSLGQDSFVMLWVDKHDNAYRWAQNKKFVWNEHTQSCQIIPTSEEAESAAPATAAVSAPAEPAAVEPSVIDDCETEKLLKIGVPEELIALVRTIRDLDDLDRHERQLPQDAYENLFALFDGEDIDDIIAEIEAGKAKEGEDSLLSNNNKRRFVEITDDECLAKIMEQGMEKWQLFLHPSQRKLVDSDYNGPVKVSGSAGTGKTIAAIHRLKHLASQPSANVLFTTYTTALSDNLRKLVAKMDIPTQNYELNNIDKVLKKIACANKLIQPNTYILDFGGEKLRESLWEEVLDSEVTEFDWKFLNSEYNDVILYNNNRDLTAYLLQSRVGRKKSLTRKQRAEVWRLKEKYEEKKRQRNMVDWQEAYNRAANHLNENDIHPYTNVIADEFQDFTNPQLRFLRALVKEGRNDLFLTGDPFQKIYRNKKMNFSAAGINVRGKRSQKLKVNYRTTEEIKRIAVSVVKGQKYDDLDGGEENNKGYVSLVHGERPTYHMFESSAEEARQVLKYVEACEAEGIPLKDICIAAKARALYKDEQDLLHRSGVKYCEVKNGERQGEKDGISFCTFHSLKGLEYRVVILVGVNEKNIPSQTPLAVPAAEDDNTNPEEVRSLLYVAMTRARQMVFLTGYGEPTGLLEVTE